MSAVSPPVQGGPPRILVVYPHNFILPSKGINVRVREIMKYLTGRGFRIDLLSLTGFEDEWPAAPRIHTGDIEVENIHLYHFPQGQAACPSSYATRLRKTWRRIFPAARTLRHTELPDFAFPGMKSLFNKLVENIHYDFILVSYAFWAGLVEKRSFPNTSLLLEISDFLTLNLHDACQGSVDFGALLTEEVRRVNLFDKVFCISDEELRLFSRLAPRPAYFHVPHFMSRPSAARKEITADACLVASGNPHNAQGIRWLFDQVLPLLPKEFRLLVVGKITEHLPRHPANVTTVPHAESLDNVYASSRMALCPLLGGTGMKIKVVEALAHGLPVVCTRHGVTGFQDRRFTGCSVADDPAEFAALILRLWQDTEFHAEQSALASQYFLDCFETSRVYETLDRVFS